MPGRPAGPKHPRPKSETWTTQWTPPRTPPWGPSRASRSAAWTAPTRSPSWPSSACSVPCPTRIPTIRRFPGGGASPDATSPSSGGAGHRRRTNCWMRSSPPWTPSARRSPSREPGPTGPGSAPPRPPCPPRTTRRWSPPPRILLHLRGPRRPAGWPWTSSPRSGAARSTARGARPSRSRAWSRFPAWPATRSSWPR